MSLINRSVDARVRQSDGDSVEDASEGGVRMSEDAQPPRATLDNIKQ